LRIVAIRERQKSALREPSYSAAKNNNFVIIAFDVPEKEKRKRQWLRGVLKRLGFAMLQRSVWAGKVRIPKGFIDDLARLQMAEFVEIFEITKRGSLRHVV